MPLVTVTYSSSRQSPTLKADIADAVSKLTAEILHKDPKVTAIIVKSVDASDWFAGGKSLAEQNLASFWLDIHVTEGTNTKDEKAAYIAAMFTRMGALLGPLHHETICMSMRCAAILTASAASPKSIGTSRASLRSRRKVLPLKSPSGRDFWQAGGGGAKHRFKSLPERDVKFGHRYEMTEIGEAGDAIARVHHAAGDDARKVGEIGVHVDRDAVE